MVHCEEDPEVLRGQEDPGLGGGESAGLSEAAGGDITFSLESTLE